MPGKLSKLLSLGSNYVGPRCFFEKVVPVLKARFAGDRIHTGCSAAGQIWAYGLPCSEAPCGPAPMYNPEEGASFLPGCCLSLLSFPSRSRKHCHPGLCCAPPAFLFLAQEWASSSPGQWTGPPSCSRAVGPGAVPRSWRPECTPLLCAVSSLEQQGPWRQPQEADCESSTLDPG